MIRPCASFALLFALAVGCGAPASTDEQPQATAAAVTIGSNGPDYFECATEGGVCSVPGGRLMAYGANGVFVFRESAFNIPCTNGAMGVDPLPNVVKKCYFANYGAGIPEGSTSSEPETRDIAYGANGSFFFRTMKGAFTCNNDTFGDPIPGTVKKCYRALPDHVFAADEGSMMSDLDATPVAYGAAGHFTFGILSGSAACTNQAFGVDPAPFIVKACYKMDLPRIAAEGGSFVSNGTVLYGSGLNGNFITASPASGSTFSCQNASLGGDPHFGVVKSCYQEPGPLQQTDLPLGDFNADGVADANDSVAVLKGFGIRFTTYGVTDDTYNPGGSLPRRSSDWQVFSISNPCLGQFGVGPEQFPLAQLPGIRDMARNYLKMPIQYLRELGRRGYTISLFEGLGRLAKYWTGSLAGHSMELVFFHDSSGAYAGKFRVVIELPTGRTLFGDWEDLTNISFDPASGSLTFRRPSGSATFTGTVAAASDGTSIGSRMFGTFQRDGESTVSNWSAIPLYKNGGTTLAGGVGPGSPDGCDQSSQEVGHTGPVIQLNVGAARSFNGVHEVGHTVAYMIREQSLSFGAEDAAAFASRFAGSNDCVASGGCPLLGSGFVDQYAASGDEDLAQTWAYYFLARSSLDTRVAGDRAAGSGTLAAKVDFIRDRLDTPDSAPFALSSPGRPQYRFATRDVVKYMTDTAPPQPLPSGGQSHVAVSGLEGPQPADWLFSTRPDGHVVFQNVVGQTFSGWTIFDLARVRLSTAATWFDTFGMGVVFTVGADSAIRFRTFGSFGELGPAGMVPGVSTVLQPAAAAVGEKVHLFAIDSIGRIMHQVLDANLQPSGWTELPGAMRARGGVFAVRSSSPSPELYVLTIDANFRIASQRIAAFDRDPAGIPDGVWQAEPSAAAIGTPPALTADGWLFAKGYGDGAIYMKRFGDGAGFELVPGL
jgi:hypothetical protein